MERVIPAAVANERERPLGVVALKHPEQLWRVPAGPRACPFRYTRWRVQYDAGYLSPLFKLFVIFFPGSHPRRGQDAPTSAVLPRLPTDPASTLRSPVLDDTHDRPRASCASLGRTHRRWSCRRRCGRSGGSLSTTGPPWNRSPSARARSTKATRACCSAVNIIARGFSPSLFLAGFWVAGMGR